MEAGLFPSSVCKQPSFGDFWGEDDYWVPLLDAGQELPSSFGPDQESSSCLFPLNKYDCLDVDDLASTCTGLLA